MDYFVELLNRYQSKGVLIDTNLLLVYFVGMFDPERIPRFKRTMAFTIEDFYLLANVFTFFSKVVTTPNILTEVNSLSNQLPDNLKSSYYPEFAKQLVNLEEHYMESVGVAFLPHFNKFGLTDAGIVELVREKYLVLTDDLKLVGYLQNANIDVINFNNIRVLNW
jgi:rRNA-processing protein FCF1